MGLAASQARFLGLTARKNNVEYEGQQINQQRTALANQTANYYNDLLGMSVPIPPSVDDYTKTVYTFNDGALTNEVTAMIVKGDGTYSISYLRQWVDDFSVINATTSIVNNATGDYYVGNSRLRTLGDLSGSANYEFNGQKLSYKGKELSYDEEGNPYSLKKYQVEDGKNLYLYIDPSDKSEYWYEEDENGDLIAMEGEVPSKDESSEKPISYKDDDYLKTLSDDTISRLAKEEEEYLALLQAKYGEGDYMVRYVQNTTTEEWNPYFYKLKDLESAIYDNNGNSQSNINCYKIGSEVKTDEVKAVEGCKVEKDSSGRYINIYIPIEDTEQYTKYALTTTTVTDQAKYDDAMNQYEHDKYQYDQTIQEINAKIEIIQAEDRSLELRLKQLDTEQEAIQTEMDAVSGVIQKNTEASFKTFG